MQVNRPPPLNRLPSGGSQFGHGRSRSIATTGSHAGTNFASRALSAPTPVAENIKAFSPSIAAIQIQRIARILARFLFRASALELAELIELVVFNHALEGNIPDTVFRSRDPSASELDPSSLAENLGFVEAYFAGLDEFMAQSPQIQSQEWAKIDQEVSKRSVNLPVIAIRLVAAAKAAKLPPALAGIASAMEAETLNAAQNAARRKGMPTIDESMAASVSAGLIIDDEDEDEDDDQDQDQVTAGPVSSLGGGGTTSLIPPAASTSTAPSLPLSSTTIGPSVASSSSSSSSAVAPATSLSSSAAAARMRQQMRSQMQAAGPTALSEQANRARALTAKRQEAERARREQLQREKRLLAEQLAAKEARLAEATAKAKKQANEALRMQLAQNADDDDDDDDDNDDNDDDEEDEDDTAGDDAGGAGFGDGALWGLGDSQGSADKHGASNSVAGTGDGFLSGEWDE